MAGKGDRYRPVNRKKYDENYDKINWSRGKDSETTKNRHTTT